MSNNSSISLSECIGGFVTGLSWEDIPDEVRMQVLDHVADTLGVGVAGRNASPSKAIRRLSQKYARNTESSVIGDLELHSAPTAALVNGTFCHAMDYDDMHGLSVLHPSAPLLPAVLATAEATRATAPEFLTALTAGYEVLLRLGVAQWDEVTRNSVFFERGFHATSIIGAVAGAAASARLKGLDSHGVAHALAIACSMGAGILEANRSGGTVKPIHCGWAAHSAVFAAEMAAAGVTGPKTVLEGGFGFFQAFCSNSWSPAPLREIGSANDWVIRSMAFKPYPCNGFTHSVIDAGLALRANGLPASDVQRIQIGTAAPSLRTIGEPIEEKRNPQTPYHAAFSAPYVLACALLGGGGLGVGVDDFTDERLNDKDHRALMDKCEVVPDATCTAQFPLKTPAVVKVWLGDGSLFEERVTERRGGPERPLTQDELWLKFKGNVGESAEVLHDAVRALAEGGPLSGIGDAVRAIS